MKTFLSILILLAATHFAKSQCENFAQKIESPVCTKPTNAKVVSTSCTELQVQWKGSGDQQYEVNSSFEDPTSNKTSSSTVTDFTCDADGNCIAIIPAIEGTQVKWSVQSVCTSNQRTFYSYASRGEQVVIPTCNEQSSNGVTTVYPNPTTDNLSVEYLGNNAGNVQFTVYDLMGRVVFTQNEKTSEGVVLSFQLRLPNLPSGIYMLEARNGNKVSQNKFMIEK